MTAELSLFMQHFSNSIPNWATFVKDIFDLMFSLEGDKVTALWARDNLTFTFYVAFSNSILNWTTFVKEVFYLMFDLKSDEMTGLWPNDSLTFTFYMIFQNVA